MKPDKYKKRPVVIEAMQAKANAADWMSVYQWIESNTLGSFEPLSVISQEVPVPESGVSIDPKDGRMIIATLEGLHWVNIDDYVIRGTHGEFYPCKPDIFEANYDRVDDATE